jgi:hypothetical protein
VDGVGHLFNPKSLYTFANLHVVLREEAFSRLDKWESAQPGRYKLAKGIALLQLAQKERDWSAFQNALDLVQRWVPHVGNRISVLHGSKNWKSAALAHSGLMSNLLQAARFIIWYSTKEQGGPRPGLYCPDWEVAVYAIAGMGQIHFCKKPGCGVPFIPRFFSPDKRNEQKYCTQAHANADRAARSKANKKAKAKRQK